MSGALRVVAVLVFSAVLTHSSLAVPVDVSGYVYEGKATEPATLVMEIGGVSP